MENEKISKIKSLLYDCTKDEMQTIISKIKDPDVLYVYMYNYNWDNGFEIPQLVLDNAGCNLSIALLVFYRAEGIRYLFNSVCSENMQQWYFFIKQLYNSILNKNYQKGEIEFKVPLSRVQLFKLKKMLTEEERIFIENIEGKCLDISL